MKALVKCNRETGLWLEDVPEPAIGISEAPGSIGRSDCPWWGV